MNIRKALRLPEYLYERARLRKSEFAIISDNCWGFELYKQLGRNYNTPFVGLFLHAECFISMLEEGFPENLSTLVQCRKSRYKTPETYPKGILNNGSEIHFLHETNWDIANEKWARRSARIRRHIEYNKPTFIKMCDREMANEQHFSRFHSIEKFNKITISSMTYGHQNHIHAPGLTDSSRGTLAQGLELYRRRYEYMDIAEWIQNGKTSYSRTSYLIHQYVRMARKLTHR